MELTGKCKEEFEVWYIPYIRKNPFVGDRYFDDTLITQFYEWSDSMQYGVYVDYFDSVGIMISVPYTYNVTMNGCDWFHVRVDNKYVVNGLKTRPEARQKAIEKANELRNEQL